MKKISKQILMILSLVCMALLPKAHAVVPAPDGCYPGFTTAEGCNALSLLGSGAGNTGVGWYSLFLVGDANYNTGVGAGTLVLNTADSNTAVGAAALLLNTTGTENVAVGTDALVFNDSGVDNTAVGAFALFNNITGGDNTAIGRFALMNNDSNGSGFANDNTAVGSGALSANIDGLENTAVGVGALAANIDGGNNVAVGLNALANNTSGASNVALGHLAGFSQTFGSDNIYIGTQIEGTAGENNTCRIGSIFGQTAAGGVAVFIDVNSKLGTLTSSKRFKEDIKPMGTASEALLALKPVTFHYKKEIDPQGLPQFGLVAEEVETVNRDLVVRDKEGKPYSVRYDQVNAMLLNEFLKEHRKVEELKKNFESKLAEQQNQIMALTSTLEKVSARIELSRPATELADGH